MNTNRGAKVKTRQLEMRKKLWPDVSDKQLWSRLSSNGFVTVPRVMPLILNIMDNLTPTKPVSSTYFEMYCRSYDESFVILNKPTEMAFYAGFSGQRAERTWRERVKVLQDLGFIDVKPGPSGLMSYALIYNPYLVVKALDEQGKITEDKFNALTMRAVEIGADDLDDETLAEVLS